MAINKYAKLHVHYETACGVRFTLVRDYGERLETTEDCQLKDGKVVRGWMTGVEVVPREPPCDRCGAPLGAHLGACDELPARTK